jgi:hypothetical protein
VQDGLPSWLAWGHPLWMALSLGTAVLAARSGLRMRRARLGVAVRDRADRARHVRLAKIAVVAIVFGAGGGPLSMYWLRDRAPFRTAHAFVGLVALALFVAAAWLGRRLERGQSRARDVHALLAALALLAGGVAAITGFVLLP